MSSSTSTSTSTAHAADYGSMSEEQKFVAEAWRTVDQTFLDRTFNGQDWFQMRQGLVKKKYKNMDEARTATTEFVASLGDKYTRYLPPDKYASLVNAATGTLAGIGVEIAPVTASASSSSGLYVQALDVQDDSPAQKAGMKPRDAFVAVDGYACDDAKCTPDAVAERVRGPVGSRVGLTVDRNGEKLDFIVTRASLKVQSVKSYLSNDVGVVKIKSFSGTTAATVADAVRDLKKKGATSLLLDLRNNPGGLLPGGVETAGLFLPNNAPIVFVVNKNGAVDAQYALQNGLDLDDPVVILVDGNTASASEVFTAALKENQRATVVGTQTFGKGVVQTIRELSNNNGGVAVTLARYETPLRNDINKQGIPVDLKLDECKSDNAASCVPASAFVKPKQTTN